MSPAAGSAPSDPPPRSGVRGEVVAGLIVLALGLFFLWGSTLMTVTPMHARIGPKTFPLLIGGGLVVIGVCLTIVGWRRGWVEPIDDGGPPGADWRAMGLIAGGLILHAALIKPLGFVLAGGVLFTATAAAFGARKLVACFAGGGLLCLIVYVVFAKGLGLTLPPGLLAGLPLVG